jgi:dUTP pyrophosphatase
VPGVRRPDVRRALSVRPRWRYHARVIVPVLRFRLLRPDAVVPRYMTPGAAGLDLVAAIDAAVVLAPGARAPIGTGLAVAIPDGWEGQVRPRSGLAREHGITVANAPGTIDSDYRGEVVVLLINLGAREVVIERGQRIAQLVIAPVAQAVIEVVADLPATTRGAGGFGSTGA